MASPPPQNPGTESERLRVWRDTLASDDEYDMAMRLITMPSEMQTPWIGVRLVRLQVEVRGSLSEVYNTLEEVRAEMRNALQSSPGQRTQAVFTAIGAGIGGAIMMGIYIILQGLGWVSK